MGIIEKINEFIISKRKKEEPKITTIDYFKSPTVRTLTPEEIAKTEENDLDHNSPAPTLEMDTNSTKDIIFNVPSKNISNFRKRMILWRIATRIKLGRFFNSLKNKLPFRKKEEHPYAKMT